MLISIDGEEHAGLAGEGRTLGQLLDEVKERIEILKPGGGYIFCTSNVAFKGMPPERYTMMMEMRKVYGKYK